MNGTARNLEPVKSVPYPTNIQKWAVIVGISKYKDESLNLKYADRDAEDFYQLLLTPVGGGFEEDHIKKLINEEATKEELEKTLRSFVQNKEMKIE